MPKRTSDQSSYSVDEMMEKLKEGERTKRRTEESELVTRPDGSKVVRVRRRRRRTQQPHKTKQVRKKRAGLIALIALVVVVVGLAGTVLFLLARFNSKGYRDDLKARILSGIGAKTSITDMSVTPFRARARSIKFTWPSGGLAKSLKLNEVTADLKLTSFIGGEWNGTEANAKSGSLLLGPPDGTIPQSVTDGILPFDYLGYRCSNTEIVYGKNADEAAIRLYGTEVTLRPLEGGGVQFLVKGGRASIGTWEELKVKRGLAEWRDDKFELISLRISPGSGEAGEAVVRSVKPVHSGDPAQLDVDLIGYPIDELLGSGSRLGRMISGLVNTKKKEPSIIQADPRFLDSGVVTIRFEGEAVTLQEFSFLSMLSDLLRREFYKRPTGLISGVFIHDREGTRLEELEFNAQSDLKLEGSITLNKKGELGGTLRVGLPEVLVMRTDQQKRPGFDRFSAPEPDGYCWISIKLRGKADRPLDNFGTELNDPVDRFPTPDLRDLPPLSSPFGIPLER